MRIGIIILFIIFFIIFWTSANAIDILVLKPIPSNTHLVDFPIQNNTSAMVINCTLEQTPRITFREKLDVMLIGKRIFDKSV